ncbi:winged helix-turn-helix domain-containing protein [Desulforamulus hydrothermalis]|uniref:Putative Response regulator receiver protein n=1 Tax=Desulforamulus hydrothermalis Lam5 = DSM 18033 TaxID=1121428 RepID=K8E6N5_9FIRM|nr:winged helix-turn-helix domain-containing protein [Desulforamulus hydrothermalis]CCO07138.1 putative Response regulator receiver protein [Desulforamulus hydrothermalis Lam5 = DSM 18033]SHG89257.1 Transcriptional regulatory protein, C terminal [Desulforamulus hydrothermalis Lam5 = DSM 18033]
MSIKKFPDKQLRQGNLPGKHEWLTVVPFLLHPDPWQRRRAAMLFQAGGGLISLQEVLLRLDRFPEDILVQALDWLQQWQWPAAEAPGSRLLLLCINLANHPDARLAAAGKGLLSRLQKQRWPVQLHERTVSYAAVSSKQREIPFLTVYLNKEEAWLGDQYLDLTPAQKRLVMRLAGAAGRFLARDALYTAVQGGDAVYGVPGDVKTHIKLLRHKLGDDGQRQHYIESKRHYGYRLNLTNVQIQK